MGNITREWSDRRSVLGAVWLCLLLAGSPLTAAESSPAGEAPSADTAKEERKRKTLEDPPFWRDPYLLWPLGSILTVALVVGAGSSILESRNRRKRTRAVSENENARADALTQRVALLQGQIMRLQDRVDGLFNNVLMLDGRAHDAYQNAKKAQDAVSSLQQLLAVRRGIANNSALSTTNEGHGKPSQAPSPPPSQLPVVESQLASRELPYDAQQQGSDVDPNAGGSSLPAAMASPRASPAQARHSRPEPIDFQRRELPKGWREYFDRDNGQHRGNLESLAEALHRHLPGGSLRGQLARHQQSRNIAVVLVTQSDGTNEAYALPLNESYNDVAKFFTGGQANKRIAHLRLAAKLNSDNLELDEKGEVA